MVMMSVVITTIANMSITVNPVKIMNKTIQDFSLKFGITSDFEDLLLGILQTFPGVEVLVKKSANLINRREGSHT